MFLAYPHIFYKISTQFLIKGKKMRVERGARREIFYFKIMYNEAKVLPNVAFSRKLCI
jgi:hypothetical protein